MVKDPVCGMEVDKSKAIKLEKNGKVYYFCSQHCKNVFLAGGEKKREHKLHDGHGHHTKEVILLIMPICLRISKNDFGFPL